MKVVKSSMVGTLESSDVQVTVTPIEEGVQIHIESSVLNQYGKQIKAVVEEEIKKLDVTNLSIKLVDKGALDCTIRARVESAIFRASDGETTVDWRKL